MDVPHNDSIDGWTASVGLILSYLFAEKSNYGLNLWSSPSISPGSTALFNCEYRCRRINQPQKKSAGPVRGCSRIAKSRTCPFRVKCVKHPDSTKTLFMFFNIHNHQLEEDERNNMCPLDIFQKCFIEKILKSVQMPEIESMEARIPATAVVSRIYDLHATHSYFNASINKDLGIFKNTFVLYPLSRWRLRIVSHFVSLQQRYFRCLRNREAASALRQEIQSWVNPRGRSTQLAKDNTLVCMDKYLIPDDPESPTYKFYLLFNIQTYLAMDWTNVRVVQLDPTLNVSNCPHLLLTRILGSVPGSSVPILLGILMHNRKDANTFQRALGILKSRCPQLSIGVTDRAKEHISAMNALGLRVFLCRAHTTRCLISTYDARLVHYLKQITFAPSPEQFEKLVDMTENYVDTCKIRIIERQWDDFRKRWLDDPKFSFSLGQLPENLIYSTSLSEAYQGLLKKEMRSSFGYLRLVGDRWIPVERSVKQLDIHRALQLIVKHHKRLLHVHRIRMQKWEPDWSAVVSQEQIINTANRIRLVEYEFNSKTQSFRQYGVIRCFKVRLQNLQKKKRTVRVFSDPFGVVKAVRCSCRECKSGLVCAFIVRALQAFVDLIENMNSILVVMMLMKLLNLEEKILPNL